MNGFYPVLNEVHDKAVKDLPLAECALFEHIWRKLIGWNKFEDEISISQLVAETSSSRGTIIRLTKNLEEKRWIRIVREMDGVVHLTNQISIPECPGIKMRLGWYQNSTTPSAEMELQVVPKQDIQQTIPTDSLKTVNNKKPASLPEKKPSRRDEELPNGMTRGELLDMLEFKPAVINYHKEEHMDILAYLGEQPRERVEWAVEQTKAENGGKGIGANGVLKWIYNGVDQYEYRMSLIPKEPSVPIPAEEKAVNSMRQLIEEFRTIDDNGKSRTGSTHQATINRLAPYRKWYDTIGNLGDIVGMQLDEYEALMNGGAK